MNDIGIDFGWGKQSVRVVLVAALITSTGTTVAANTKPSDLPAKVIAHLKLPEAPGSEMLLQSSENRRYVYVQKASRQGFMIVDVTKPTAPNLLTQSGSSNDVAVGQLDILGPDVGLAESAEKNSKGTPPNSPTETVTILDLSDPEHPRVIRTFTGVISKAQDPGRGLVFLADQDGIWILRHTRPGITPAKHKKLCASEDAIQSMPPDCQ